MEEKITNRKLVEERVELFSNIILESLIQRKGKKSIRSFANEQELDFNYLARFSGPLLRDEHCKWICHYLL